VSRALRALAVLLLTVALACAHPTRFRTTGPPPVCRDVVALDNGWPGSVTWIRPTDAHNRTRLDEWCATVGPVVFEPRPRQPVTHPIDRVAVVSWNTHVGSGDIDALIDDVRRGDFTDGEPFDAVVLLLQEMYRQGGDVPDMAGGDTTSVPSRIAGKFHSAHAHDVRRIASEQGLATLYVPSMRNGALPEDPEDRGNAILSTLPLANAAAIELPIEHQRRVVAAAEIDGETTAGSSWHLRVASVHLDTALAIFHGGPSAARERQASALVSTLAQSPFGGPILLAGDFNAFLGDREPAIGRLRAAFPEVPRVDTGSTWSGPLGVHAKLDYVFAKDVAGAIRVQRLTGRFGSDHYPLLSVIRFSEREGVSPTPSSRREDRAARSPMPSSEW
jgi:endonuclease/exonuclease/phosphatase family metal-dependent hydrolase